MRQNTGNMRETSRKSNQSVLRIQEKENRMDMVEVVFKGIIEENCWVHRIKDYQAVMKRHGHLDIACWMFQDLRRTKVSTSTQARKTIGYFLSSGSQPQLHIKIIGWAFKKYCLGFILRHSDLKILGWSLETNILKILLQWFECVAKVENHCPKGRKTIDFSSREPSSSNKWRLASKLGRTRIMHFVKGSFVGKPMYSY